jgi:hypothetical protein
VGEGEGGAKAGEKAGEKVKAKVKKPMRVMWNPLLMSKSQMGQLRQNQSRREGEPKHPRQVKTPVARKQNHLFQPILWTLPMSPMGKNPRARVLKPHRFQRTLPMSPL